MEALFFWIFAVGLASFGLGVILTRNPVTSALCLAATFIFLAALFVTLEAFFLAMVQIIVYAGAVMVLFLFIIMLLDVKAEAGRPIRWGRIAFIGAFLAGVGVLFHYVLSNNPWGGRQLHWGAKTTVMEGAARQDDAFVLGQLLFDKYLLPFEITAVLLLMATIGVVLLSRRETNR
jgi:NADH-quinone oxidoreductase subunit J